MDLSDYLKSGLHSYHKQQGSLFGKRLETNTKSKKLKEDRRNIRDKLMSKKRLIGDNPSPYKTPTVPDKNKKVLPKQDENVKKRLEMLKKWKEQKIKKVKEDKAKAKPAFKVTHISSDIGMPNLENINKVIKGKLIKPQQNLRKKSPIPLKYEFAPKNYQFKGPNNIASVNLRQTPNKQNKKIVRQKNVFEETVDLPDCVKSDKSKKKVVISSEEKTPKKTLKVYKKTPAKVNSTKQQGNKNSNKGSVDVNNTQNHYDLRNRRVVVNEEKANKHYHKLLIDPWIDSATKARRRSRKSRNSTKEADVSRILQEKQENARSVSELSTEYSIENYSNSSLRDDQPTSTGKNPTTEKTPNSKMGTPVYISPFVTISRGKTSARKEFHSRKSKGGLFDSSPDMKASTGPKAGAAYFHKLLDGEISRIQGLCDEWNVYKEEQKPPEEACDMINVATGQSQLLLGKKFNQFRNLIRSCESGDSDMPITCEDLHGYWDTAYIQVENLNRRFDNLVKLRSNNWEEIIPEKRLKVVKKTKKPKPKAEASSRLKDAIKAARNKAKATSETENDNVTAANTFDGGFFSIQSPEKSNVSPAKRSSSSNKRKSNKARKSLLVDVLKNETIRRESSPGLIMWKVVQTAKSVEKETTDTPARSILKTRRSKSSVKKRSKSVLFKDEENCDVPVGKLISLTPEEDTSRRSSRRRLTRTKLF